MKIDYFPLFIPIIPAFHYSIIPFGLKSKQVVKRSISKNIRICETLNSVHPEIVDFGSGQGLSVFATAGIVWLFRGLQKSENAALSQKMLFPDRH
jgi:hypothetical protein